jgi:long-chain acyl-CoA synthetase
MDILFNWITYKCKEFSNNSLLILENGSSVTYASFKNEVDACSQFLHKHKLNDTLQHFSIIAPNCPQYLYFLFACIQDGHNAVNLNPNLSPNEIKLRLLQAKVDYLFITKSSFLIIQDIVNETFIKKIYIINEEETHFSIPEIINTGNTAIVGKDLNIKGSFLQFTGGTSGVNKAAIISQSNILNNIQQLENHLSKDLDLNELRILIAFPFYHIFSIVFNVLFFASQGASCILYKDLRNTDLIIALLNQHKINFTVGVHTWYKKIMQHPQFLSIPFHQIRASFAGGEYVPLSTKQQWQASSGKSLYSAYGLTETSSLAIMSPLNTSNMDDSIGIALPFTEVTLFDENNLEILQEGFAGEIALKGPQVTQAYFENEEETQQAFHNNWFKTGDIAVRLPGNFYKIVDRKKDMIAVSGNKVYPNEVEEVLLKLPYVLDVGVVGKFSEKSGEEVCACVVINANTIVNDEEMIHFCKEYLSSYKLPKTIVRYKELPKTPIGKTARRILKEEINRL